MTKRNYLTRGLAALAIAMPLAFNTGCQTPEMRRETQTRLKNQSTHLEVYQLLEDILSNPIKNKTDDLYHDSSVEIDTSNFFRLALPFSGYGRVLKIHPYFIEASYLNSDNSKKEGLEEAIMAHIRDDEIYLFSNENEITYTKNKQGIWSGPKEEIDKLLELEQKIRSTYK